MLACPRGVVDAGRLSWMQIEQVCRPHLRGTSNAVHRARRNNGYLCAGRLKAGLKGSGSAHAAS